MFVDTYTAKQKAAEGTNKTQNNLSQREHTEPDRKNHEAIEHEQPASRDHNNTLCSSREKIQQSCDGGKPEVTARYAGTEEQPHIKNKICVISSIRNRKNRSILNTILDAFDKYQCLHFSTPSGGIHELITTLSNHIQGYTRRDYCILMIGEEDFEIRNDYDHFTLVQDIRTALEKMSYTNIIVCTPTYICGAPIYNYRIELFNTTKS
jgi:hypothetical protein